MKNIFTSKGTVVSFLFLALLYLPSLVSAQTGGRIAEKVNAFKQKNSFAVKSDLFSIATSAGKSSMSQVSKVIKRFTLLDLKAGVAGILKTKPSFLHFTVPVDNGQRTLSILLYKESISPNGFTLLTSDGKIGDAGDIVHYKGAIDADANSVAAFSFSANEVTGMISNREGNFVLGKLQDDPSKHIIYNDKDLVEQAVFDCGTNTNIPHSAGNFYRGTESATALTQKCVNWYWETDVDIFTAKGSLANVNTYMQGVFNQVQTLYANDGVSITLKTLYVWTTTDPYTGTSTSGYLDQFGAYRTSFDGDLATLIGTQGGGGIAWINGLCNSQTKYKMAYCGISTTYSTVPTFSWTVECITHEQGHLLGSRHTHDCAWNGNNTKIDGCGDLAGYTSGTCAVPPLPVGGGTIMSYCHLTSAGINFNLGFGPQPKALIVNNVNNATCLVNCTGSCINPAQPGTITGNAAPCAGTAQTYSIAAVAGATSYTWSLPAGSSGSSTTNSINVTTGTAGGTLSVTAVNSCGASPARTLTIAVAAVPAIATIINGNAAVCAGSAQAYSIATIAGATSYTWTLPAGWSGSSTTNSINAIAGSGGGTISVKANNNCGSGAAKTLTVSITSSSPAQPGSISGAVTVCPGSAQTYSIALVAGASTYNWTLPAGWTGSSTSNIINVTAGTTGGLLSVTASNGCGTSAIRSTSVATGGTAAAAPGPITVTGGGASVCTGDSRTYSVPAIAGISYSWSAPTGMTINSGQGTGSINATFTQAFVSSSTLSVTATNSCGTGPATSIIIAKKSVAAPGSIAITGGIAKVCIGDTRTYTVPAVAGMTYTWVAPAGANINSGQGTASVNISYTSNFVANGILSVRASNLCGISAARNLSISRNIPVMPVAISGPASICTGSTAVYSIAAVANATGYSWAVPATAIIQGASNGLSVTVLWTGSRGGTVSVKSLNNCGSSGSRSLKVVISCSAGLAESKDHLTSEASVVYPNPTTGLVNVKFYSKESAVYNLKVTDITGRTVLTDTHTAFIGSNVHTLNLSRLAKGTYLVLLEAVDSKQTFKIYVQ